MNSGSNWVVEKGRERKRRKGKGKVQEIEKILEHIQGERVGLYSPSLEKKGYKKEDTAMTVNFSLEGMCGVGPGSFEN